LAGGIAVGTSLIHEDAEEFFAQYDFESVIDLWEVLGAAALMMMGGGMSPHLEPLPLPLFEKGPHSVLDFLEATTRALCAFAYSRDTGFKPEVLWRFSGSVRQWCADQTASHCARAITAFELARTELNRTLNVHRKQSDERNARGAGPVPRQARLRAVLDAETPYVILDDRPIPAEEVAVHYLDALIGANGGHVPFARFLRQPQNKRFEGAVCTRVLDRLPSEISPFIERGKGSAPRLKVELLTQTAQ
jgi:hypothetical protein